MSESPLQPNDVIAVFLVESKRPGELHEQTTKSPRLGQRGDAVTELLHLAAQERALVGKAAVQLGRELEIAAMLDLADPQPRQLRA